MNSTVGVAGAKRNFILQQGLEEPTAASCPVRYSALLFQRREQEYGALLGKAGLRLTRVVPTESVSVVEARAA